MKTWLALLTFSLTCFTGIVSADWPQFQGPNRNSVSTETGLLAQWPESGPAVAWTFKNTGLGYSCPAIVGDKLYITGATGAEENLICLDANTGNQLWTSLVGPKFDFEGNSWGAGPRSTPSVSNGMVLALGGQGNLICCDATSGKLLWSQHMMKDLGGEVNPIGGGTGSKPGEPKLGWGYSWSPLIDGDRVICYPGGSKGAIAAVDLKSGKVIWRSEAFKAMASYSSPIAVEIEGVKQYVVLHNGGVVGLSAKDGSLLWSWEKEFPDVAIPTPVFTDGMIFASACKSCGLIKVLKSGEGFTAEMVFKSKATRIMKSDVGGPVVVGGNVFGYSDKMGWVCQKLPSGDSAWIAREPLKAGSVVAIGDHLICYDEEMADVALVEANPEKFVLKSKFALPEKSANKAPNGRNWTPPVVNNGHLFIRDQELLFCFKIKQ